MEKKDNIKVEQDHNKEIKKPKLRVKTKGSAFKTSEVIVLVLLTCIISLGSGLFLQVQMPKNADTKESCDEVTKELDTEMQEFIENYNNIVGNYYKEVDKNELINSAIKGMIDSLDDPHSSYLNDEENDNFNILLKGSFEGLGIQIINDETGAIVVYTIFANSPAEKSDLRPGDVLLKINDIDLNGKTTDYFASYVRTNPNNNFNITYKRGNNEKTIIIKKEVITIQSVFSKTFKEDDKKIGYLRVNTFASNTYTQFKEELNKLENEGIDSLIVDLRNNSGGHLIVVKNMIALFLDSSHVIYQTQDKEKIEKTYSTGTVTKDYPIVFLANKQSASASEVMIGALKDEYGAQIVGETTFGKGTVQELQTISSGDQYKITTMKWLTPSGYWVNDKGIKPDYEIGLKDSYYSNPIDKNDNQLQKALEILKK